MRKEIHRPLSIAVLTSVSVLCTAGAGHAASKAKQRRDPAKSRLLRACAAARYRFTPKVRKAFLTYAQALAQADLKARGKVLPKEFLAWVHAHPLAAATVYGAHGKPSDVLLWLYSLRLDLGDDKFEKYHQLALAMAVACAKQQLEADITPRDPLTLTIGGDPREPVNTKDPGRPLDMNDHIINFLNENTIEEDVVVGYKEALPELKYDERGVAIPAPRKKGKKRKKVPITETRTRTLYAADVLASRDLQAKLNAYLKAKGHEVQIDCGDRLVHWKSRNMIRGGERKRIKEAYLLFRSAYESKGLLPAKRDPFPSPGERCVYLIRNHEYEFPPELQAKRKWPRFPLTAPWPTLVMLVSYNQPLREREERWEAFRDEGVVKTYGEYIGSVAQQFDMQSARRLKPYPYTYGTIQMMLKDGGVCGAMANISVRSHNTLGIPASSAGQPGHCAMVAFRYDPKTKTYSCRGGQYATGGDDKTLVHSGWLFGDLAKQAGESRSKPAKRYLRKFMVYHQSIAWAVNFGLDSYLDSMMAYYLFHLLPEAKQQDQGRDLLESGFALNPYNIVLLETALDTTPHALELTDFWRTFEKTLAGMPKEPGCPKEGLYNKRLKTHLFARIGKLATPKDRRTLAKVLAFLEEEDCNVPATLVTYRLAHDGLRALLSRTERQFEEHLKAIRENASSANDVAAATMAATIKAVSGHIRDREQKKRWALDLWKKAQGNEKYFGKRYRVTTNPTVPLLAKFSGQKMRPEPDLIKPILDQVSAELKRSVSGERSVQGCRQLAAKIKAAGSRLKDSEKKRRWLRSLSKIIAGRETFTPKNAKKGAKPVRDPCAHTIASLLQAG